MKRFVMVVALVLYASVAYGGELEEKQLEYRAYIMEINYCDQRIKVLQHEVKRLEKEIAVLMQKEKDKEEAGTKDIVPEKDKE